MPLEMIRETNETRKALDMIKRTGQDLVKKKEHLFDNNPKFGYITPEIAVYHPTMGYSGKFANSNQKFMQNPDADEDHWLTSDEDLELLLMICQENASQSSLP
jgi:hypothetical protein